MSVVLTLSALPSSSILTPRIPLAVVEMRVLKPLLSHLLFWFYAHSSDKVLSMLCLSATPRKMHALRLRSSKCLFENYVIPLSRGFAWFL